jgi:preprotein translocase subunit SecE
MGKKQVAERRNLDGLKWGGICLLWILSFVAYYFFTVIPIPFKIIGWIIVILVSVAVLMATVQGKSFVLFAKSAYVELQKVVWPTRKEAGQIALIVVLVVFLAGMILWGVDSVVMWGIGKITLLTGEQT